jgi:hypothetical protein
LPTGAKPRSTNFCAMALCADSLAAMECPPPVQHAIERIQGNRHNDTDEKLVAAWMDWYVQQQSAEMSDTEKWQSPTKRLKSSADASLRFIVS